MTDFILSNGADNFPPLGTNTTGDDFIDGRAGADTIHGGGGNDLIDGGTGADSLFGDGGNDLIDLGAQPSGDFADGGSGTDTIRMDFSGMIGPNGKPVKLTVDFGTRNWSVLVNGNATVDLTRFEKLDVICGDGNDTVYGGALGDTINGAGGNDLIKAGDGDDQVAKTWGIYKTNGGAGIDMLIVENSNFKDLGAGLTFDAATGNISAGTSASGTVSDFEIYAIAGTANADSVTTGALGDAAHGLGGNDLLTLGGGNDSADGGAGADTLYGGAGADELRSGIPATGAVQVADRLYGGAGDDHLIVELPSLGALFTYAGAVFNGGADNDLLEIQPRNATLDFTGATLTGIENVLFTTALTFGLRLTAAQVNGITNFNLGLGQVEIMTAGNVAFVGKVDFSVVKLFSGGQALDLSLSIRTGPSAGPSVLGGAGSDTVVGSSRGDIIAGNDGDDSLSGMAGFDTIAGGAGADIIYGGDDNDFLTGGAGGDILYGGTTGLFNKDMFFYTSIADSGTLAGTYDVIEDFLVAGGGGVDFIDRFDVSQIDAKAATTANDVFGFIGVNPFSAEGQIRATQVGLFTMIELNIAGTGGAEMVIWLDNFTATNLTQFDFFL